MLAKVCDRCHKVMPADSEELVVVSLSVGGEDFSQELCSECLEVLINFLTRRRFFVTVEEEPKKSAKKSGRKKTGRRRGRKAKKTEADEPEAEGEQRDPRVPPKPKLPDED